MRHIPNFHIQNDLVRLSSVTQSRILLRPPCFSIIIYKKNVIKFKILISITFFVTTSHENPTTTFSIHLTISKTYQNSQRHIIQYSIGNYINPIRYTKAGQIF